MLVITIPCLIHDTNSMNKHNLNKYLAEIIGTFALVFCGTGAIIVNEHTNGSVGLIGIALAFGLIIMAMIYIFGNISGAHINPSVTLALTFGKSIPLGVAAFYICSQIVGALLASLLLKFLFPENVNLGMTSPSGGILQSLILEFVMTFFLMLTILGVTSNKESASLSGLVIGLMVTGIIFIAGPISGGSFNPARSIGPAIVSGNISGLWIYLIAPTLGAILAVPTFNFLNASQPTKY